MTNDYISKLVEKQRVFFHTGTTLQVKYRIDALKKLKSVIIENEDKINEALKKDLGKSNFESYMCETGMVLSELSHMIKHTKRYSKDRRVSTPLAQFSSRSYKKACPYGVTLIMSPWNYPFLLTLDPLIDAIAAGNTAIVKPSAYSPNTSEIISQILSDCFNEEYIAVVKGGRDENNYLLNQHFDYIFFTGSQAVGMEVMSRAAQHLTPVTLELGGKSPCIVDAGANIRLAAKRIVFGKYLNCGQTCVAPDYIYCEASIKDRFIEEVKKEIIRQFGDSPLDNADYGKIINAKHFNRISALIDSTKLAAGGKCNPQTMQIEPTVLDNVTWNDAVMQEEIFGPVMPVLTFNSIDEVISTVNSHAHPLALYLFTSDKKCIERVTSECGYGGGCINDTIIHLATSNMGFGGFGESGMGSYHGKTGFDTFSHYKSIVNKKTWIDLPMRYQPYTKSNEKLLKTFLK